VESRIADNLGDVPAAKWNRLIGAEGPFTRYEFLRALETSGSVGGETGWQPGYLLVEERGELIGALPLYRKYHSYGEFVFDWAWARAYAQHGLAYYPKLVVGIPFTPATGPRLLIAPGADRHVVAAALIREIRSVADRDNLSSIHWLFTNPADTALLEANGFKRRVGCQFHWRNDGYRDFDDFLATFSSAKRKKIRRERRHVAEAGITIEVRRGAEIEPAHWEAMYGFYRRTVDAHGAIPYLTRRFFTTIGDTLAPQIVMVLARETNNYIAGALNFVGPDTLYGRYWGTHRHVNGLHFEVCYYRAIEFCIAEGLAQFEAGAQGEHKIARGFSPTATYSAHWLRQPEFADAIEQYLVRERQDMHEYIDELSEHLPFKDTASAASPRMVQD